MNAPTKQRCESCGIWCYYDAFDLTWLHMGWTVNGKEQPKPHRPVITEGGMA